MFVSSFVRLLGALSVACLVIIKIGFSKFEMSYYPVKVFIVTYNYYDHFIHLSLLPVEII